MKKSYLSANMPFGVAYQKAEEFSKLLQTRTRAGGFMKSLMLQRICSSFASGLKTAQRMLKHSVSNEDEDEDSVEKVEHILSEMTPAEVSGLKEIETQLSRPEAVPAKTFEPRRSQSGDSTTLSVISCVFMASIICFVSFMVINSEVDDE